MTVADPKPLVALDDKALRRELAELLRSNQQLHEQVQVLDRRLSSYDSLASNSLLDLRAGTQHAEYNGVQLQRFVDEQTITPLQIPSGLWPIDHTIESKRSPHSRLYCGQGLPAGGGGAMLMLDLQKHSGATLWRDWGYGNEYHGLGLYGLPNVSNVTTRVESGIGWHQMSNYDRVNRGKATFRSCTFQSLGIGALFGRSLDKAGEMAADYEGWNDDHADHSTWQQCQMFNLGTCFLHRNNQSVNHRVDDLKAMNTDCVWYFERGGQLTAHHVEVGGRRGTLLRLGFQDANNTGVFSLSNVGYDGSGWPTFKLLEMDDVWLTRSDVLGPIVKFTDTKLDFQILKHNQPPGVLFEVKGQTKLILDGGSYLRPGSIRLQRSAKWLGRMPYVSIHNFELVDCKQQSDVIDWVGSTTGSDAFVVDFEGCWDVGSRKFYDRERVRGVRPTGQEATR